MVMGRREKQVADRQTWLTRAKKILEPIILSYWEHLRGVGGRESGPL